MIINQSDLIKEKEYKNRMEKFIGSLIKASKWGLQEYGLINKGQELLSQDLWEILKQKR